jgi:uncharacterized protein YcnI
LTRITRRLAVVGATCAVALLGLSGVASAHVTANPNTAQQGGYAKVSFRVPTERDDASTVQLEIDFPADHPLASVSTRAVPGWTAKVEKTPLAKSITTDDGQLTEAISKITWTGGKIPPGSFEEFDVSMGPLPDNTDQLVLKALQTYDNGEVVRWIDTSTPGGAEPEHPAPVLKLTPKAAATSAVAVSPAASSTDSSSSTGTVLGIIAIVLAAIALAFSVFTRRRGANRSSQQ